jgi:predicted phage-related endonuclease
MPNVTTITTTTEVSSVELDKGAQALIAELRVLRDQSTALEKQKTVIRNQLMDILGDAEVGIVDGVVRLRQREESRRSVDYDTLWALASEVYTQVVSTSTFRKLDIK